MVKCSKDRLATSSNFADAGHVFDISRIFAVLHSNKEVLVGEILGINAISLQSVLCKKNSRKLRCCLLKINRDIVCTKAILMWF